MQNYVELLFPSNGIWEEQMSIGGSREVQKSFGRTISFIDDIWTKTSFKKPNLILDSFLETHQYK